MENKNVRLFQILVVISILPFAFLFGCVNPNSNVTYASCCWQSEDIYDCTLSLNSEGNPISDGNGHYILKNCGDKCAYVSEDFKDVFDSSLKKTDISLCTNNCNFQTSDCTNTNEDKTCYLVQDGGTTEKSIGPICVQAAPNPCVQNECTAMFCGEPVPNQVSGIDAQSSADATDENKMSKEESSSYKALASEVSGGLLDKVCRIESITRQNARLLDSDTWFVNSLRLGIQGTFSDYDRVRYYLPPSDFYSGTGNLNAIVDKFTNYLDTDADGNSLPLADFITAGDGRDYKALLTTCSPEFREGSADITAYVCNTDDSRYEVSSYSTAQAARLACTRMCLFTQTKTCEDNVKLLSTNIPVSPPGTTTESWPFVDIYRYGQALKQAYPTPAPDANLDPSQDPRNYYKELLPYPNPTDSDYEQKMVEFAQEAQKPGPAGAKVFECTENSDCLSGQCDTSQYSRGSCFLKDGTPTDCSCHYVTNCALEYPCNVIEPGTTLRAACVANLDACRRHFGLGQQGEQNGQPMVVCDYDYTQIPAYVGKYLISYNGLMSINSDDGTYVPGCWDDKTCYYDQVPREANGPSFIGIKQFRSFACVMGGSSVWGKRWQPDIEMAVVKRFMTGAPICQKEDGSGEVAPPYCSVSSSKPEDNCHSSSSQQTMGGYWIGNDCDGTDNSWGPRVYSLRTGNDQSYTCPAGYALNLGGQAWRDYDNPYSKNPENILDNWGGSFEPVPSQQALGNPGNYPTDIFTAKTVQWCSNDQTLSLSGYKGSCTYDSNGLYTCSCSYEKFDWVNTKFKVIQACNLKLRQPGQSEADDWDVELVQPNFYNSSDIVPSRKSPGATGAYMIIDEGNRNAGLVSGVVNSGYEYLDKTWRVRSMGYCQTDGKGRLIIQDYGMCKPSGTVLSLAYQNVTSVPDGNTYCPTSCSKYGEICVCSSGPTTRFHIGSPGGYITNPEYNFLTGKMEELQSSGILPMLDMRTYNFTAATEPDQFCISDMSFCQSYAAVQIADDENKCRVFEGVDGNGIPIYTYDKLCEVPASPDWFLTGFLPDKHSAVIIEVRDLPQDCPNGDKCDEADDALQKAKTACMDCLLSLEYAPLIDASKLNEEADAYPSGLKSAIESYSEYGSESPKIEFDPDRMQAPTEWIGADIPPHISRVSALTLNIDFSKATDSSAMDGQMTLAINMSRHVLQHLGWPTIWKLNYNRDSGPQSYAQSELYKSIYARERELTLSGVLGILLPPLDNANPDGSKYSSEQYGRLLDPSYKETLQDEDTVFCAAQNGSKQFLHPQITAGVRRIYTKDSCACVECTNFEITQGQCTGEATACLDGQTCTKNEYSGANFKCENECMTSTCNLCEDSSLVTTCTALTSSNEPPVECCQSWDAKTSTYYPLGCKPWPDCSKWTDIPVSELANANLHPDYAFLVSALPKGSSCCMQNITTDADGNPIATKYFYTQSTSLSMQSEPNVFPGYGSNESDCGRPVAVSPDNPAVCGSPVPPLIDRSWSCTTPH